MSVTGNRNFKSMFFMLDKLNSTHGESDYEL